MSDLKYRDREWLYRQFVVLGKDCPDIAKENGWTTRVVQKWANEKYGFNSNFRRDNYIPTQKQLQVIYAGVLGDGCISQRKDIDFTQYIFTQCKEHREYILWIYENLKTLCNHKELKCVPSCFKNFYGKNYVAQESYRLATRGYHFLNEIKAMSKKDIMSKLDELGLALFFLDDGSKRDKIWDICMGNMNMDDTRYFVEILAKFKIDAKRIYEHTNRNDNSKSYLYVYFDVENSRKIDNIILRQVPNNIDIVKKKVGDVL